MKIRAKRHEIRPQKPTQSLTDRICQYPKCRKRMNEQEYTANSGVIYLYCHACRVRQVTATRAKYFKIEAKKHLLKCSKDSFFLKLNETYPGFASFQTFKEPLSPVVNSRLAYVHFLKYDKRRYYLVAEVFSELFGVALPNPTTDDIRFVKKILYIITTKKMCIECKYVLPTYYIPENHKERPEHPVSFDEMVGVLEYFSGKSVLRETKIKPAYFKKSYPSKDNWMNTCKDCKRAMQLTKNYIDQGK